ncbi:hypothetical protein KCU65_g3308, partial [Aureobasidium melanogenum]
MPTLKRDREAMDDQGARKKIKTSPAVDETPNIQPIMDLTADEPQTTPGAQLPPSQETQALKTLRNDFDDIRQLITCKICERLLYEPYVISCGHTYCYSCLCTWFSTTKKKKTCPNCREVITQPPAPSYVIREMINIFMRSHNILDDGEAIEQHQQWAFEEAEANCGVLMDSLGDDSDISTTDLSDSLHAESIEDDFEEDDMDADPEFGELDGDFDGELDPDIGREAYDAWLQQQGLQRATEDADLARAIYAHQHRGFGVRNTFHRPMRENRLIDEEAEDDLMGYEHDDEDLDEEDEDEDAGSIDDFLDDRDINDITAYSISSQTAEPTPARQRHNHSHNSHSSSDSDSDSDSDGIRHNPHFRRPQVPVYTIPSDDEEPTTQPTRSRRAIRIVDSDDSSSSGTDSENDDDEAPRLPSTRLNVPASRRSNLPVLVTRRQARPIRVLDSEDEEDEVSSASSASSSHHSAEEGEDEDQDQELHYNNYSDDIEAVAQGGAEDGFSPMQSEGDSGSEDGESRGDSASDEGGGDQHAVNYFNVYGDEDDGQGDSEDEDEDDY